MFSIMNETQEFLMESENHRKNYIWTAPLQSHGEELKSSDVTRLNSKAENSKNILKICHICLKKSTNRPSVIPDHLRRTYFALCGAGDGYSPAVCLKCFKILLEADRFADRCAKGYNAIRRMADNDSLTLNNNEKKDIWKHSYRKVQLSVKRFTPNYCDECVIDDNVTQSNVKEELVDTGNQTPFETQSDDDDTDLDYQTNTTEQNSNNVIKIEETTTTEITDSLKSAPKVDTDKTRDRYDLAAKIEKLKEYYIVQRLSIEEQIEELQKKRLTKHYRKAPYKCVICYSSFSTKKLYDVHMHDHSEAAGPMQCEVCSKRFSSTQSLHRHETRHLWKYTCKQCPFHTVACGPATQHLSLHDKKFRCEPCNQDYNRLSDYMTHMRVKHPDEDTICVYCGFTYLSPIALKMHHRLTDCSVDKKIPESGPWCVECQTQLYSEEALSTHMRVSPRHDGGIHMMQTLEPKKPKKDTKMGFNNNTNKTTFDKPLPCTLCGVELSTLRNYHVHKRTHHPKDYKLNFDTKQPMICDICGKLQQNSTLLRAHMMQHDGVQFKCNVCDKVYKSYTSLANHRGIHSGKKQACKVCDKAFSTKGNLNKHMVIVHGNVTPLECKYCDKRFKVKASLDQHMDHVHFKKPWPKRNRDRSSRTKEDNPTEPEATESWSYVS